MNIKRKIRTAKILEMNGLHKEASLLRKIAQVTSKMILDLCSQTNTHLPNESTARLGTGPDGSLVVLIGFDQKTRDTYSERDRNEKGLAALNNSCKELELNCIITPLGIEEAGTPDSGAPYIDSNPKFLWPNSNKTRVFVYSVSQA